MKWEGKTLETAGELMDAILKCANKEEAQEFMKIYRAENEFADSNIGYMSGYYTSDIRSKIQDWCSVEHPIFGKTNPTPKEAFEKGKELAERDISND